MASTSKLTHLDIRGLIANERQSDPRLWQALININTNLAELVISANRNFVSQDAQNSILYGSHVQRLATSSVSYRVGTPYIEYDRKALYVANSGDWLLITATMYGNIASRPSDLLGTDAGFVYFAIAPSPSISVWSGSAWVEFSTDADYATGSNVSLTTSYQDSGCSLTLDPGRYVFIYFFDLQLIGPLDAGSTLSGILNIAGSTVGVESNLSNSVDGVRACVGQTWFDTIVSASTTVKTQVKKSGGSGSSTCWGTSTSLLSVRLL